jgi:hypothetical protein
MVRLRLKFEPCINKFFLLPKREEVTRLYLTEVTDCLLSLIEGSVGPNLELNPVDYEAIDSLRSRRIAAMTQSMFQVIRS